MANKIRLTSVEEWSVSLVLDPAEDLIIDVESLEHAEDVEPDEGGEADVDHPMAR